MLRIAEPPVGSTGRALSTGWDENQIGMKPGAGQVVLRGDTVGVKVAWSLERQRWLRTWWAEKLRWHVMDQGPGEIKT